MLDGLLVILQVVRRLRDLRVVLGDAPVERERAAVRVDGLVAAPELGERVPEVVPGLDVRRVVEQHERLERGVRSFTTDDARFPVRSIEGDE